MKRVELSKGKYSLISDEDYERVSQYKWTYDIYPYRQVWNHGHPVKIKLHRFIMNPPKGKNVDHINGDKLDNRRDNLRICTSKQNRLNKHPVHGKYGYKGVYKNQRKNGFFAAITVNNKTKYIGFYKTPREAAAAYNKAALKHFGEYSWPNVV